MLPFVGVALRVCDELHIIDKAGQGVDAVRQNLQARESRRDHEACENIPLVGEEPEGCLYEGGW